MTGLVQQQKRILIVDDEQDIAMILQMNSGFHFYQKIRKIDSRVKVCFLTATEYFHEEIRKKRGFEEFDQELFLRKPIETEDLVKAINKLLESS